MFTIIIQLQKLIAEVNYSTFIGIEGMFFPFKQ